MVKLFSFLAVLFLLSGCSRARNGGEGVLANGMITRSIQVGGMTRSYELFIPSDLDTSKPVPVILAFHGGGTKPENFAALTDLNARAGRFGYVVVYPAGYKGFWHAGDDCCGPALQEGIDDVAFVREILADLERTIVIDPRRIFSLGFSEGGKMTYRLACELSDRISAIAESGSSLGVSTCTPQRPVPVLAFHGTADTFNPYQGGKGFVPGFRMVQTGAPQTIRFFSRLNSCLGEPEITYQKGAATCISFTNCAEGATVTLCTIEGMGHQWPGHTFDITPERARSLGIPEVFAQLGPGTEDIDATDMALEFFQNHPKPQGS